jgi:hypothetical protein
MRQAKDSEICHLSSIGMKESRPIHQCSQSSRKTMIVMIISTDNQFHC